MDNKFLEQFYEKVILPLYGSELDNTEIKWKDHGQVEPDSWAHYFDNNGREYVLLYEDFPSSSPFGDGLSHEIVKLGEEPTIHLDLDPHKEILNITGYFTLYREKRS